MLLAALAATGPWPCPICGQPMYASMARSLHLHHGDAMAKLAGLPGDQLAHARCNIADGGRLGAEITNRAAVTGRATVTPLVRRSRVW
jgi:hypothetical protein